MLHRDWWTGQAWAWHALPQWNRQPQPCRCVDSGGQTETCSQCVCIHLELEMFLTVNIGLDRNLSNPFGHCIFCRPGFKSWQMMDCDGSFASFPTVSRRSDWRVSAGLRFHYVSLVSPPWIGASHPMNGDASIAGHLCGLEWSHVDGGPGAYSCDTMGDGWEWLGAKRWRGPGRGLLVARWNCVKCRFDFPFKKLVCVIFIQPTQKTQLLC